MLSALAIAGYRSLRDVRVALGPLDVVTGPNGSGKSSLPCAPLSGRCRPGAGRPVAGGRGRLSVDAMGRARDRDPGHAARRSAVQGQPSHKPVSLKLGFADQDYGYAIDLGLPIREPGASMFFATPRSRSRRNGRASGSHAPALVTALEAVPEARAFVLEKRLGETVVEGETAPGWKWPER